MATLEDIVVPHAFPQELTSGAPSRSREGKVRVLLVAAEEAVGLAPNALRRRGIRMERAHTLSDLQSQHSFSAPDVVFVDLELAAIAEKDVISAIRAIFPQAAMVALASALPGERAAELLCAGVPSLPKPVGTLALADLALELFRRAIRDHTPAPTSAPNPGIGLESTIERYAKHRSLSRQQCVILRLYLSGENDKQIACSCGCAEATVYEHWRRMGKKAGGSSKADAVVDFHRFLAAC